MSQVLLDRVTSLLHYTPEDGVFAWRVNRTGKALAGSRAGTRSSAGYVEIKIDGIRYSAHRLAWLVQTGQWPVGDTDHINGVKDDNRFCNLREATRAENCWNRKHQKNSAVQYKGVTRKGRKWQSIIVTNGVGKYLGLFDTAEAAHQAYALAAARLHGAFARVA